MSKSFGFCKEKIQKGPIYMIVVNMNQERSCQAQKSHTTFNRSLDISSIRLFLRRLNDLPVRNFLRLVFAIYSAFKYKVSSSGQVSEGFGDFFYLNNESQLWSLYKDDKKKQLVLGGQRVWAES